jgi:hypothetical protein
MNPRSPSLAELQQAVRRSLHGTADDAARWVLPDGLAPQARLSIYRNTATAVLANAIRLAFPAVQRLVGAECFEGAAGLFVRAMPPSGAWLDEYGSAFPAFLEQLPEIASVTYLADVARLEWRVNAVLHAPELPTLDLARLAPLGDDALGALSLQPHPAVQLLRCEFPADAIWRAVLEQDDRALHAIRFNEGPVHLLVQRTSEGVDVARLGDGTFRIATALFAGEPIREALSRTPDPEAHALLAALLARGCFAEVIPASDEPSINEGSPS